MIRTGDEYRESIRDGREVWIDGERVQDIPSHPAFKPIVDAWARIYDLAHEDATPDVMSYVNDEDRRRLFAFARDLLNSGYAGHRLTFQLFAQSPPFAHLLAVYNNYDFAGPLDLVRRYAGLSDDHDAGAAHPVGAPTTRL
jgi:aromatic ring hydroxylase